MELISRDKALVDSNFASHIFAWQQIGNPSEEEEPMEEGKYYDDVTDAYRFFSVTELESNHKKKIDYFNSTIDEKPNVFSESIGCLVVVSPNNVDSIHYCNSILCDLMRIYELELIFIPLYKTKWFNDDEIAYHDRETNQYYSDFKKLIGNEKYEGGILISEDKKLKLFLHLLLHLVSANYYSYNFFYSEKLKVVISFHYSGEIWFYTYDKAGLEKIKEFVIENKLLLNKRFTTYE